MLGAGPLIQEQEGKEEFLTLDDSVNADDVQEQMYLLSKI